MKTKATYERPVFQKIGSIEGATKNTATGTRLDAPFQSGVPLGELTLS